VNPQGSWVGRYVNRESVIAQGISAEGLVTDLITGNAAVRTAVFRELGGFDETIRVAGGEDTDFGYRLRSAGHRIVYAPAARVHHESRVDLFGYLRMIFRHGRGRRRLGERFPSYRLRLPYLRLFWLSWPLRSWMPKDYRRYRSAAVSAPEALAYVLLRYLENLARVAGYIRGA
jgi:GT2 family glycosyltransferase